jgi:hypothetical protein
MYAYGNITSSSDNNRKSTIKKKDLYVHGNHKVSPLWKMEIWIAVETEDDKSIDRGARI